MSRYLRLRQLSIIEINFKNIDLKCHSCHNWNSIDKDGLVTLNDKKKNEEALFNFYQTQKK